MVWYAHSTPLCAPIDKMRIVPWEQPTAYRMKLSRNTKSYSKWGHQKGNEKRSRKRTSYTPFKESNKECQMSPASLIDSLIIDNRYIDHNHCNVVRPLLGRARKRVLTAELFSIYWRQKPQGLVEGIL